MRVTSRTRDCLVFEWDAAAEYGSAVEQYHLEIAAMPNGLWQPLYSTTALCAEAKGLLAGQRYNIRACAENLVGTAPVSCCEVVVPTQLGLGVHCVCRPKMRQSQIDLRCMLERISFSSVSPSVSHVCRLAVGRGHPSHCQP